MGGDKVLVKAIATNKYGRADDYSEDSDGTVTIKVEPRKPSEPPAAKVDYKSGEAIFSWDEPDDGGAPI